MNHSISGALIFSLVQVRHPHCVQIMAASADPSDPFIVMEWVPGGNWFDKLAGDPPPPAHERIKAVRETSSALQYQPLPATSTRLLRIKYRLKQVPSRPLDRHRSRRCQEPQCIDHARRKL
jgi:hypothetical protein